MASAVAIRAERTDDEETISQVIKSAFLGMPYADGDESELVVALRAQNALSVSLVAELEGAIVGHIAFSPARSSPGESRWYALGPVAVLPAHQRLCIGSKLVLTGLQRVFDLGAFGCVLTGNPAYYSRFGFAVSPGNAPPGEPAKFFMVKLLRGKLPTGPIHFHKAFGSAA